MTTPITPSVLNTPKPNGAATQTQQPVAPKPNTAAPAESPEAKLAAREAAFAKQQEAYRNELKKNAEEKKGLGAKLSELNELRKWKSEREREQQEREQQERMEALNPISALERRFGKDWKQRLMELGVHGVPPADMIAEGMMRLEKKLDEKFQERDREASQQRTSAQERELSEAREGFTGEATRFCEAKMAEYPLFEGLGDPARVASILVQRVETDLRNGKSTTLEQAAEGLERELLGFAERAVRSEKYKAKLQGETKPANVSPSSGASVDGAPGTPRRTLDNSMTASTSGRAPARSDAEREQRAMEAFNAARNRSKT